MRVLLLLPLNAWFLCLWFVIVKCGDLDFVLSARHSNFGYWKCENDVWMKKYNPSYEKPRLSCPEMEKARNAISMAIRCTNGGLTGNCTDLCLKAGGEMRLKVVEERRFNRCVGRVQYPSQPCTDYYECEHYCVLGPNVPGFLLYPNSTLSNRGYFLGPGRCWDDFRPFRGFHCDPKGGYFERCSFRD